MRRIAIALAVALATPSWAQARTHTIAPPGNSGVGQYVETLPTAGGGQPTSTVHSGGAGGPVGRGGTGGGPGSSGGAVASSTQRALARQGPIGDATAALAQATAPRRTRPAARSGHGRANPSGLGASGGGGGSSPSTSVLKALSGSTSSGGLGPLLPIALIGSVLAAAVLTLVRRRRTG